MENKKDWQSHSRRKI